MFKVSVIIPTYNDEDFLENCVEHVIKQTMGFNNIQIILVDDVSTDKSFEIAQKYQKKYPKNIISLKLDKNSGAGGRPRNLGIEHASRKIFNVF